MTVSAFVNSALVPEYSAGNSPGDREIFYIIIQQIIFMTNLDCRFQPTQQLSYPRDQKDI